MGKKKKKQRSGNSILGLLRAGLYAGAIVAPGVSDFQAGYGIDKIIPAYAGIGADGKFDWAHIAYHWTPFIAWSGIDWAMSKFGVWRRAGRAMKALSF